MGWVNLPKQPKSLLAAQSLTLILRKCVRKVLCHSKDRELGNLPVSITGRLDFMEVGRNILRCCQLLK